MDSVNETFSIIVLPASGDVDDMAIYMQIRVICRESHFDPDKYQSPTGQVTGVEWMVGVLPHVRSRVGPPHVHGKN